MFDAMKKSDSFTKELWVKHFPQLMQIDDDAIQRVISKTKLIQVPSGIQVSSFGSCCNDYILVANGSIKVQLITEKGREVVLYHVRSGEGCVLTTSCLLSGEAFPAEGYSEDETQILALPADEFDQVISDSSDFRKFVFNNFSQRLANVISRIEQLCTPSVDRNLAALLLRLYKDDASPIQVTHQDLASELGTAREVVSRHLKKFELEGWLELGRGTIKINSVDTLIELANN